MICHLRPLSPQTEGTVTSSHSVEGTVKEEIRQMVDQC